MKRMSFLLVMALSVAVWAQDQPAPASNAQKFSSNVADRPLAPTYSDLYCAGFVSKENIPTANRIVAGYDAPHMTRFFAHNLVYLEGSGYAVGNRYTVLRKVQDPNHQEMFPGQRKLLQESGFEYAELGRIAIVQMEKDVAVGEIEFSCQAFTPGDFLIPFQEKPQIQFRSGKTEFKKFAPFSGTAGRIIDGREFDQVIGTGAKVYVNIGANKGLKPGDYLRITRNYDPKNMDPIDALSLVPPNHEDSAKDVRPFPKDEGKKLPFKGVGELIVLSVTPETATAMVTLALEDIQVGDVVEVPARKGQQ